MIHIYLCEDDKRQLSRWTSIIEKYLLMNSTESLLYCTASAPDDLLKVRKDSNITGLYFLDIDLQAKKNGIELAEEIRKYDPRGYIVFVTTHSEMAYLTFQYKVEAMDFIIKDKISDLPEQIYSCIRNAESKYRNQLDSADRLLSIKVDKASLVMDQDDIVAITTSQEYHKIVIHTLDGFRQMSGSLKELSASLNSHFCQCNRSTIVNLKHVIKYSRDEALLYMNNKESYPVSVRLLAKVHRSLKCL